MENVTDGRVKGEKSLRRGFDRWVYEQCPGDRETARLPRTKCADAIGMLGSVYHRLKEDIEAPKKPMHLEVKGNGVAWAVHIRTLDEMDHAKVEHI